MAQTPDGETSDSEESEGVISSDEDGDEHGETTTAVTSEVLATIDVIHQVEKEGHGVYALLYRTAKSQ